MGCLTAEEILARAGQFKREQVEVPEWGGSVWVRELPANERDRFEGEQIEAKGLAKYQGLRARLVCLTACDETGKRLFTDAQVGQVGSLPVSGVDRVFEAAMRVNRLTAKDVEDLEKNSEPTSGGA